MDEIARLTPSFHGVSYARLEQLGSIQWPCNEAAPAGTPVMHVGEFARGKGYFALTDYVPTGERANRSYPLLLTTGRILSQYNVGAQTRRTANTRWHGEDLLEIHPSDAEERGIRDGDIELLREDVGRHNALDKLLGALCHRGHAAPGFVLVTSRASYEMVAKAAGCGVELLAAVSAPTALAVQRAAASGLTLVGFAREGRHVVYSHAERFLESPAL